MKAAEFWEDGSWLRDGYRKYTPWALADAARVSVVSGNEYRSKAATERDLLEILAAYSAFEDKAVSTLAERPEGFEEFMLRLAGQQLTWQEQTFNEFARSAALLTQTPPNKAPRVVRPGWDIDMLGCPLSDYVGIAQIILGAAINYGGRFEPAFLDRPDAEPICQVIPKQTILQVINTHFATNTMHFRQEENEAQHSRDTELRRYEYNPLLGHPFLTDFGSGYLTPAPRAIIAKASPLGLYHTGVKRYGDAFAQDFGELLEQYVGRQLRLLPNATVIPEIHYRTGRRQGESVDWITVFDELVLLVEVKSRRPTYDLRLATDRRAGELQRMLARAYTQIDTTAQMITTRNPAFTDIPHDRQILGLIITQEPFHLGNAPLQRQYMPETNTPVIIAGVSELEVLVTITDAPADQLLRNQAADQEQSTWALNSTLTGHEQTLNTVLNEAWASYPWSKDT